MSCRSPEVCWGLCSTSISVKSNPTSTTAGIFGPHLKYYPNNYTGIQRLSCHRAKILKHFSVSGDTMSLTRRLCLIPIKMWENQAHAWSAEMQLKLWSRRDMWTIEDVYVPLQESSFIYICVKPFKALPGGSFVRAWDWENRRWLVWIPKRAGCIRKTISCIPTQCKDCDQLWRPLLTG